MRYSRQLRPCTALQLMQRLGGFAMLVTVSLMVLLSLIAIGLLSLATVEVRTASRSNSAQEARNNARMAMMIALGELQKFMGPDQRVCANAGLLSQSGRAIENPNWLGVWRTRQADGKSLYFRDENGGLRDKREELGWEKEGFLLSYLVSGNEGGKENVSRLFSHPAKTDEKTLIPLVGKGSVLPSRSVEDGVKAPLVRVDSENGVGHFAYWVGDLSARANVAVMNPYHDKSASPSDPENGGYYPRMTALEVDETLIGRGLDGTRAWKEEEKEKLVSTGSVEFLASKGWAKNHFHDFTHYSRGVLADVRDGGLKGDLSYFLEGAEGEYAGGTNQLHADDPLVGWDFNEPRENQKNPFKESAPRFGILRDWLANAPGFAQEKAIAVRPASEVSPRIITDKRMALANDNPSALKERQASDLLPILVEGSMYSTFSYHPNPAGFRKRYNIRSHHWPRVVLWNPYDVALDIPRSVMMMQLNTRNDFHTTIEYESGLRGRAQWVSWGGGTRSRPPAPFESILDSENYNDPYTGMYYFALPQEKIGAGECIVFSTEEAREYDSHNVLNNRLSARVAPDPTRNLYFSSSEFDDDNSGSGFDYKLIDFWYATPRWLGRPINNQADDSRMIWKEVNRGSSLDIYGFDSLPQLSLVSCSLQFGAGKEPRVSWSAQRRMPIEFTTLQNPVLSRPPDVRTREGFRLRWFEEHESNRRVLNNPAGPGIFDTAPLANWNPRAAYAIRNPWENIGGDQGDGSASGPWFFGNYTRDLYDDGAVGWNAQQPRLVGSTYRGNPFGTPQDADFRERNILFAAPKKETGVLSLAQFQHSKITDFSWHPAYAIGNSLCDPRLESEGLVSTVPESKSGLYNGWDAEAIGWSSDNERSASADEWARFGRAILQDLPTTEPVVYDLSFELNHTLWDRFFLSSGKKEDRERLVKDGKSLPNSRMVLSALANEKRITSYDGAAASLYVEGAFNVNSTSVEAWKALLGANRDIDSTTNGSATFPRFINSQGGYWSSQDWADDEKAWTGTRVLSESELDTLARLIVEEVKLRGPFLSLSDFVNRRLRNDETGRRGVLQAAIDKAGLNLAFENSYPLDNEQSLPDYRHPDNIKDATRLEQVLKPESKAWGATTFLTQADVLQVIGPTLTARSDSFVIRAYGDSLDKNGQVQGRAWCEATVQRTPEPLVPDDKGLNPDPAKAGGEWGRRFRVVSIRWLTSSEV